MKVFELWGSVDLKDGNVQKKLDGIDKKAKGTGNRFDKLKDVTKKAGKVMAVGVGAAATAMVGMAKKAADAGDHVHKASQRVGVSAEAYQELDYWAGQNGMSQGDMEKAVGRLNQRIGMAKDGNEKYANALEATGVNMDGVRDGTISTEDAFATSIQTLSGMNNEQEKAALAAELFGTKLGRELMPALQDGSLSIEEAKEKAREMGIVMSEDAVNGAADMTDMMDDASRSFGAIFTQIGLKVMPMLMILLGWIQDHMPEIQTILTKVFDGVGKVINVFIGILQNYLIPAFSFLLNVVQENMPLIESIITTVMTTIKGIITTFVDVVTTIWDKWGDTITTVVKIAFKLIREIIQTVMGVVKGIIETIMGIITGDWSRAWEGIKSVFSTIWEAIKRIASNLLGHLKEIMSRIVGSIVKFVVDKFNDMKDKTIQGIKNMKDGVVNWFEDMKEKTIQKAKDMVDYVKSMPGLMAKGFRAGRDALKNAFVSVFNTVLRAVGKPINGIIKGANWVLGKFNAKKIGLWDVPQYAKGTKGHMGGPALVNDQKGSTYEEMIQTPDGHTFIPKGRNVLFPNMPKGTAVLPADETKKIMRYKKGIGIIDGLKNLGSKAWSGFKSGVGSIWDFVKKPLDLVSNVIQDHVSLKGITKVPLDMAKGIVGKGKDAMVGWVKGLFKKHEDPSEGGMGSSAMGTIGFPGFRKTSAFGYRRHPIFGRGAMHTGVDLAAPTGTPVYAQKGGRVLSSGWAGGYGKMVKIGQGIMEQLYAHLSQNIARVGTNVKQGQLIGKVGNTGNSTGSHLHYEVRRNGRAVHPGYEEGGFVDKHQIAEIAEGDKEELIVPMTKRGRAKSLIEEASNRLGINNEETIIELLELIHDELKDGMSIYIDGRNVTRLLAPYMNNELGNRDIEDKIGRGQLV